MPFKVDTTGLIGPGFRLNAWPTDFPSVDSLKAQIGRNGTLRVPVGETVRIAYPNINPGARVPQIVNLNKRTPFEVKTARIDGKNYLEISCKANARHGQTDNVKLYSGPLVAPDAEQKLAFPFKLEVAFNSPFIFG